MRKKTLGTLLAATAMAFVAAGFGLRMWANTERDAMPMFWAVHVAPDGRVMAEVDDTLYIESADEKSLGVIPLGRFGVKNFEGDFAILSDDSIILQDGELPHQTSHDVIRATLRGREEAPDTDTTGAVPLQRCSLQSMSCTPMTGPGDYLKLRRTFKLYVDEAVQRIYVADTEQQRVVMLDYTGKILASKTGALQFPNQLQMTAPGELTVVDTNHNRFVTFAVKDDQFGAELKSVKQRDWMGFGSVDDYFPTGFAQTEGGAQWAIIAGDNLTNGMLFRREEGAEPKRITLPQGADVLTIAAMGKEILVPDNASYRIHYFGRDGEPMGDFGSETLDSNLDRYASMHSLYAAVFKYSLWLMLLVALPLLLFAAKLQKAMDDDVEDHSPVVAASVIRSAPAADGEAVDVAAVQANAGATAPAWMLPGKVYEFHRQWGKGTPFEGLLGLGFVSVVCLGIPGLLVYMDFDVHLRHPQAPSMLLDWHFLVVSVVLVAMLLFLWASYLFERVYVNRLGMGYQSFFYGPLGWLAWLRPGWAWRWEEIAEISLRKVRNGRQPAAWYYLIKNKQGETRRVSALAWRLRDRDDGNPRYKPGIYMDPEVVHSAIYKTALYRLLGKRGQL